MYKKSDQTLPPRREILFAIGSYDDEIHRGAAEFARAHNWHLRAVAPQTGQIYRFWDGDGLLCCPGDEELNAFLRSANVPKVNITGYCLEPGIPIVREDALGIARIAAEYFEGKGFRHYVFVAAGKKPKQSAAFREALRREPLIFQKWFFCDVEGGWPRITEWLVENLRRLPKPVAVFCNFDHQAEWVIHACGCAGIDVPSEVAVLGAGNQVMICENAGISISSVDSNRRFWGYEAARILECMMNGEDVPEHTVVPALGIVERSSTETAAVSDSRVARAIAHIRMYLFHDLSLDAIAMAVGTSRATLTRLFRAELGLTVNQEIQRQRIERAKLLLRSTDQTAVEVAAATGFSSPYYFYRTFRQRVGLTAGQYRAAIGGERAKSDD